MINKHWANRLKALSEAHKAGRTIWYRRKSFTDPAHRDKEPKWHIFSDRTEIEDDKFSRLWTAKCGYKHKFDEFMFEDFPNVRIGTKPLKRTCCIKCRKEDAHGD